MTVPTMTVETSATMRTRPNTRSSCRIGSDYEQSQQQSSQSQQQSQPSQHNTQLLPPRPDLRTGLGVSPSAAESRGWLPKLMGPCWPPPGEPARTNVREIARLTSFVN